MTAEVQLQSWQRICSASSRASTAKSFYRTSNVRLMAVSLPFGGRCCRTSMRSTLRFDRLESEYAALKAGLQRVEERLATVEQKLDRMALRSELLELKERVVALEQRIAELEADL